MHGQGPEREGTRGLRTDSESLQEGSRCAQGVWGGGDEDSRGRGAGRGVDLRWAVNQRWLWECPVQRCRGMAWARGRSP